MGRYHSDHRGVERLAGHVAEPGGIAESLYGSVRADHPVALAGGCRSPADHRTVDKTGEGGRDLTGHRWSRLATRSTDFQVEVEGREARGLAADERHISRPLSGRQPDEDGVVRSLTGDGIQHLRTAACTAVVDQLSGDVPHIAGELDRQPVRPGVDVPVETAGRTLGRVRRQRPWSSRPGQRIRPGTGSSCDRHGRRQSEQHGCHRRRSDPPWSVESHRLAAFPQCPVLKDEQNLGRSSRNGNTQRRDGGVNLNVC